ncbi:MAG: M23 family metallopeptidase [Bacilli bacterium]|nr:M23 family metallopeptidase [Bacilli bacterium]
MFKENYKKMFVASAYLLSIGTIILCITIVVNGVNNFMKSKVDYDYGVYGVFEDIKPVVEEVKESNLIIKPFIADTVTIGKYFYDYEADKEEQEKSLVYYENTYMQNSGIDYISDNVFDIVSILDGEVTSVKEDEVLGKTVQVKHSNELISVYQAVDNIVVKEGDIINQGAILATSGSNNLNTDYANMLHFEIYFKGELLDPENIYNLDIEDFN